MPGWVRPALRNILVGVILLGAWDVGSSVAGNDLMPGVTAIARALWEDVESGLLWFHAKSTLKAGVIGLLLGTATGLLVGQLMARQRLLRAAWEPLIAAAYPVPKLALYPVLVLLLGIGERPKIAIVAVETFFVIAYSTLAAVRGIDQRMVWVAQSLEVRRLRVLTSVVLPAAAPGILAGLRIAVHLMLLLIVAIELLGENRGLGYLVRQASVDFAPEHALGVIFFLVILGYALDRLVLLMTRRISFWEQSAV